jgi:hypothetical protein
MRPSEQAQKTLDTLRSMVAMLDQLDPQEIRNSAVRSIIIKTASRLEESIECTKLLVVLGDEIRRTVAEEHKTGA